MKFLINTRTLALTLGVGVAAMSNAAWAVDGEALIKRYQAVAAQQGQTFSYDGIEQNGDDFTVKGPTWTLPDVPPIKGERATFSGVTEEGDGAIAVKQIDVRTITSGNGNVQVTFESAGMNDLRIPADGETDILKQMAPYSAFNAKNGVVTMKGKTVATIADTAITLSPYTNDSPITFGAKVGEVALDLTSVDDPKFKKAMADLGYDGKFTGRMDMDGTWTTADGKIEISTYDIAVDNVGTLSFPMSFGGYTIQKAADLQKMSKEMQDNKDQAAQAQAAMAVFQDIQLIKAAISFKDDSVTKRGLEMASKQMQQPPEALAAAAPMMVGMGMANLQMPELTEMVSSAIGTFLQNPGTFEVSVEPSKPLPVAEIVAAGQASPQSLPKLLNLQIKAE